MDAQLRLMPEGRRSRQVARPAGDRRTDSPEAPAAWRLDDSIRAVGRSGIAQAREALRQARLARLTDSDDHHHPAAA